MTCSLVYLLRDRCLEAKYEALRGIYGLSYTRNLIL